MLVRDSAGGVATRVAHLRGQESAGRKRTRTVRGRELGATGSQVEVAVDGAESGDRAAAREHRPGKFRRRPRMEPPGHRR